MDKEKFTEAGTLGARAEAEFQSQWAGIGISNDFIFGKVMQDKELLAELVRIILPGLEFTDLEIQEQKPIELGQDIHGVRFDIFAVSETGDVIEVEMQVYGSGSLPKRLRYYGSMADSMMLDKGMPYSRLRDSYVIIIGLSDPYGEGRHRYTFTNRCTEDTRIEMGDGTVKIFLNAKGDADGRLRAFLDYVAGKPSDDGYVKKLDRAVQKARANKEWRREYMTLMQRDLENQEIGREEERREQIADMLRKGRTPEAIADFCGYPLELVQRIQQEALATR